MPEGVSQTEKFDISNYIAPKNWTRDIKKSYVSYITVNQGAGTFCLIVLYSAVPGSGSAETDFVNEWNELAVKPYNAVKNPKTEIRTNTDGWKIVAGASAVQKDNISSYIILSVFSGFDKTISVLSNLNDQAYVAEIDKFLENLKPDKNASLANRIQTNNQAITMTNSPGKFGQLVYNPPKGWNATSFQNGVSLSPADLPSGEHLEIRVISPLNFSGTMKQALAKSYDEVCTSLKVTKMTVVSGGNYEIIEPKKSFKGWEYIRCSGGIHVNNGTPYPDEYGLDLFMIKINNRYERIAVIKSRNNCGTLSRYYPSDRREYDNAIERFLFSIHFDDWQESSVIQGAVKGTGIVGVWQGLSLSVGLPKPGASLGAELTSKQLILFSNGQAYFGKYFPVQGLDELNTWIAAENNRRDWGTYTFNNGKGILKMPYGDIPLRVDINKLIVTTNKTDHGFIRSLANDDAKINGTYVLSEWNGTIPSITFTTDGKFTDNGALRILYHEYTECLNPAVKPGSGTYIIRNYSLLFNYNDGRKIKIAFPGTDRKQNNSQYIIASFNYDVLQKQ